MEVSTRTILKVLLITSAFIGVIYSIYATWTVLTWIITAFSLALALNPAVAWVQKRLWRHNRIVATLLVFLTFMGVIVLLGVTMLPAVVTQTEQLVLNLPRYTMELSQAGTPTGDFILRYDLINRIQDSQSELISRLTNASGTFVNIVAGVFSSIVALLTILGLTFFMLMEGPAWIRMFWESQTSARREHYQALADEMYQAVVGYVGGKILAAFLAGLSAFVMLAILHVPYAAALALVVGILSIIPLFGATLGAAIVVAICLFTSVPVALIMAVFFVIYQQIENTVIQPIIFKKIVDVSPLLVGLSVLIGTAVAGILGALIAIPLTASIQILVKDYYSRRAKPVAATAAKHPVKAAKA